MIEVIHHPRVQFDLSLHTLHAEKEGYLTSVQRKDFLQKSQAFLKEVKGKYSPQEQQKISQALFLMTALHLHQKPRLDGPFIFHPLQVSTDLVQAMQQPDVDMVVAELLHDSVEDQAEALAALWRKGGRRSFLADHVGFVYLRSLFGSRAVNIIKRLSHLDFDTDADVEDDVFDMRILPAYGAYIESVFEDPDACITKAYDFRSNIRLTLSAAVDNPQKSRYMKLYGSVIPTVLQRLKDTSLNVQSCAKEYLMDELHKAYLAITNSTPVRI